MNTHCMNQEDAMVNHSELTSARDTANSTGESAGESASGTPVSNDSPASGGFRTAVASRQTGDVLYRRKPGYIPRVAAVHDMCGYGKCSLTAAIPILSAAGCDVCPVPTGIFSAHTHYETFTFRDTTDMLPGYLDAWRAEGVEIDAVYSGFLGNAKQVEIIRRIWRDYPAALRIVDPVMGDNGELYATYDDALCKAMGTLADGAQVLTPNLTEAAILTGTDYHGLALTDAQVRGLLEALLALGTRSVVLKGIDRGDGVLRNFVADAREGIGRGVDRAVEIAHEKLPFMAHGTGDAFASALCGAIMTGHTLAESARIAGRFVHDAMVHTQLQPHHDERGVSFELDLHEMAELLEDGAKDGIGSGTE